MNRLGSAMGVGSSSLGQVGGGSGSNHSESSVVHFEWPICGWDMLGKNAQPGEDGGEDEEVDRPGIMRKGIIIGDGVYRVDIGMPLFCSADVLSGNANM